VYNTGCAQPNGSNNQLRPATYSGAAGSSQGINTFKTQNGNFTGITTGNAATAGAPFFTAPAFVNCALPYPETCPIPEAPGLGRNSFRGPRYIDVDATISKSFGLPHIPVLGENAQFEFRANVYNLFNNLNMNPTQMDNIVTDQYFGSAKKALGSRTMELQARFSF
jgi:hypothetical protein